MRSIKGIFLVLAVVFSAVTVKFIHSQLVVDQEFGPSSMLAATLLTITSLVLVSSYLLVDGRFRDKVIGFWMIAVSSFVTFLAADLLAGFLLITPLSPQLVPDAIRHHRLVPNAHAKFEQKDFSYVQRNNELGLRGKDVSVEKPNGTYRIIALGDSFTMGKGVEDDQTFSFVLEEILQRELGECRPKVERIEVLNAGVDSYSPLLAYLYLSQELGALEPNLVIFNLDNSDVVQEAAYRSIALRSENGTIVAVPGSQSKKSPSMRFRHWIENNLYMTRLILFYTNKWMGHKDLSVAGVVSRANSEAVAHTLVSDQQDRRQQWESIFESIELMNELSSEQSYDFLMTVYPWPHQVSKDLWNPGRETFMEADAVPKKDYDDYVIEMAQQLGISAISLYDAFEDYSGKDKLYFDHDMHFTTHGHKLMAHELARLLAEKGYTQNWCAN